MRDFFTIYCIASGLLLVLLTVDMLCYLKKSNGKSEQRIKKYMSVRFDLILFIFSLLAVVCIILLLDSIFKFL